MAQADDAGLVKVRDAQVRLDWQLNGLQTDRSDSHARRRNRQVAASRSRRSPSCRVPKNPVTEQAYQYRLDGDTAVLELPASDGFQGVAWRFEIKLAK